MNMVVQPHDLPCTFRVAARVRLLTQLQSFCAARNTFLSSAFSPSFFKKIIHYFILIDDLPTLECTHRTLYWRQPLGATSFFWVGGPCGLCLRTFTTDLASVWPLKIISPSPYTHLRLLSFVQRPFLLFTRCPCSRGNDTMTNFLLPGRLLQVCTISNSPMFYLLLFCNLKFEKILFSAHTSCLPVSPSSHPSQQYTPQYSTCVGGPLQGRRTYFSGS